MMDRPTYLISYTWRGIGPDGRHLGGNGDVGKFEPFKGDGAPCTLQPEHINGFRTMINEELMNQGIRMQSCSIASVWRYE